MQTLLQAITVLNSAGVCVFYSTAWKYLKELTLGARYLEIIQSGHWMWLYDNVNLLQGVRHERDGEDSTYTDFLACIMIRPD